MGNLSHSSITRRIRTILLVALVLASTTTYLIALVSGYHYIDKLFEDKVQNLFTSIENELVMFDHALTLVEQDWEIELRDNLPKIAQELKSGQYQLEELEAKTLKEMAQRHGLTDLYLINSDLVVTSASFKPDIGLDMSQFSEQYTEYLRGLLNQGTVGIDRINVSTETGQLKKYAYYSEPGSDLIVNADIGVFDRIQNSEKPSLVSTLYEDITQQFKASHSDVIDIDVFNISKADQWSLFTQGRKLPRPVADQLYADQPVRLQENGQTTIFRKAPFSRYEEHGFKVYAMIVLDLSERQTMLLHALFYSLGGTLLLAVLIWFAAHWMLQKHMTQRLNELMLQMGQISGAGDDRIDVSGEDEVTQIGATMNKMLDRIAEEEHKKQQFENLSHIDALTQVANRRKLDEVLNNETSRVSRGLGDLFVIMVDVDWFKPYNDHYGHLAGDETLRSVANILSHSIQRSSDLVARFGGEEFVCVIPGADRANGHDQGEKILERVRATQIPNQASPLGFLTVSAGCLFINNQQLCTADEVIRQVDLLLYQSKSAGRNRITCGDFKPTE